MAKSKYRDDFPELAEKYAKQGLTDDQIAGKLGIGKVTYYSYQNKYPNFLNSIKRGKIPVNLEVENALLKRALGYEYDEITRTIVDKEVVSIKIIKKHVIPDVAAEFIWLKNRVPERWKDRQDIDITIDNLNPLYEKLSRIPQSQLEKIAFGQVKDESND